MLLVSLYLCSAAADCVAFPASWVSCVQVLGWSCRCHCAAGALSLWAAQWQQHRLFGSVDRGAATSSTDWRCCQHGDGDSEHQPTPVPLAGQGQDCGDRHAVVKVAATAAGACMTCMQLAVASPMHELHGMSWNHGAWFVLQQKG